MLDRELSEIIARVVLLQAEKDWEDTGMAAAALAWEQATRYGAIVREELKRNGYGFCHLDGDTAREHDIST